MKAETFIPIHLLSGGSGYCITMIPHEDRYCLIRGMDHRYSEVHLSARDVRNLRDFLGEACLQLAREVGGGASLAQLAAGLLDPSRGLATKGFSAARELFGAELGEILGDLRGFDERAIVEVVCPSALPWELLYSEEPGLVAGADISVATAHFWGMRWNIARRNLGPAPAERPLDVPLKVGLVVNEELGFARAERDSVVALKSTGRVDVELFTGAGLEGFAFQSALLEFLSRADFNVLHFACHADHAGPLDSSLGFGYGRSCPLFRLDRGVTLYAPIVILNACSTTQRTDTETFDFVRRFMALGAQCVVAAESVIGSSLAARMGREILVGLADGLPPGVALLRARRSLVGEAAVAEDLTGLFYSVHGNARARMGSGVSQRRVP